MAESSSKDLLKLEESSAATSESKLFVCKKYGACPRPAALLQKPATFPVLKSQVLGKVKDFLGVLSESNEQLLNAAKENPDKFDIEVLSGKESEVIEMDLMLGIADLHTPEAVAAAESAIAGHQPANYLSEDSSSGSESEDTSDDDDDEDKKNKQDHDTNSQSIESASTKRDSPYDKTGKQKHLSDPRSLNSHRI